jgi:Concanavalin A-like lectin/glucanases superfamily
MYISGVTIKDYLYPAAVATPYAASFNGSNQSLSIANNAAFNFGTGSFTIECWFYATSNVTSQQVLFDNYQNSTTGYGLYIYNGAICMSLRGDPIDIQGGSLSINTWYHVAVSGAQGSIKLFLNGTQVGSTYTGSTSLNTSATIFVGSGNGIVYMNGYISNMRVIKGTALYTSNFAVPSLPLTAVANTSLLTCNAATLVDGSTNAFTLTNNGSVTTTSATVPSFAGYSNSFNGSTQYLNLVGQNLSTGNFTIEAWVYLAATGTNGHIFNFGTNLNNRYAVYISGANKFSLAFVVGGTYTLIDSTFTPSINTWYHVAYVRNSGTSYLYVNGTQVGSNSTSIDSGTNWGIGHMHFGGASTDHWNGYISNFRVNNTALYTSNFTPSTTPLQNIAGTQLLTCNESTIVDNSSNGYAITNNNGVTVSTSTIPFTLATTPTAVGTGGIVVYERPYSSPISTFTLSALLVGGGGGAGYWGGGGGGSGGVVYTTNTTVTPGVTYNVIVGQGGTGGTSSASTAGGTSLNGGSTVFNNLTALGGGGGFGNTGSPSYTTFQAANGGSGGGVGIGSVATVGSGLQPSSASGGYGNAGGNSTTVSPYPGGAGGGAGAVGGTGTGSTGGAGGIGITNTLLNLAQVGQLSAGNYYVGGGGGSAGTTQGATAGAGGLGGGGAGSASGAGTAGTANTGGGGGGPVNAASSGGGAGGSGVAILASPYVAAVSSLSGSPTIIGLPSLTNYSGSFNGSNNVSLPTSTTLAPGTGNFTIEFWINPTVNMPNYTKIYSGQQAVQTLPYPISIETQTTTNVLTVTDYWVNVFLTASSRS